MRDIATLKHICENSQYVAVDFEKINAFLNSVENWDYNYWLADIGLKLSENECILFAFICESMNFCFWENRNWYVDYDGKKSGGAVALFYSVMNEIESNPAFLDIDYLLKLDMSSFSSIMESKNQVPPLLAERFKNLKETIAIIASKKEKFYEELFSVTSDLELLNYIVKNFSHFDDQSELDGQNIHFNKRAILLTNDLYNLSKK